MATSRVSRIIWKGGGVFFGILGLTELDKLLGKGIKTQRQDGS